jgi:UDP-glucuronate 4-epimerase
MVKDLNKEDYILVTGIAGFIGFHLVEGLCSQGYKVIGIDNINDYYDVNLKYARLDNLGIQKKYAQDYNRIVISEKFNEKLIFYRLNLEDRVQLPLVFDSHKIQCVINLAAQAGVRYSIDNPEKYIDSNIVGFLNILECCRHYKVKKLLFASSSSVYGNSNEVPFKEPDNVDFPISLYAATKKSNELMAHTYSHLYGIQTIGLRFFTVYGPWGRPDMAIYLFTKAIIEGNPINVFNHGNLSRDFTYIDDIVQGMMLLLKNMNNLSNYDVFNIGNNSPVKLMDFIKAIESAAGKKAVINYIEMQAGDVEKTWACTQKINNIGHFNSTSIEQGIVKFVEWYLEFSFNFNGLK